MNPLNMMLFINIDAEIYIRDAVGLPVRVAPGGLHFVLAASNGVTCLGLSRVTLSAQAI